MMQVFAAILGSSDVKKKINLALHEMPQKLQPKSYATLFCTVSSNLYLIKLGFRHDFNRV